MNRIYDFFKVTTQVVGVTGLMLITTQCGDEEPVNETSRTEDTQTKVTRSKDIRYDEGIALEQTETSVPLAPASWAGRDPADIAEQFQADGVWDQEKGDFYKTWGVFDPQAALAHIESGDRKGLTGLKASVVQGWASSDITTAREWISKQAPNAERAHYVTQAIQASRVDEVNLKRNPELESWLIKEQGTPGIKQAMRVYATPLLSQDLDGTLKWIGQGLEKGALREGVARGIMKYTASQSRVDLRDSLINWMSNTEPGDFRDDMIYAYVQENAQYDVETTLSWAKVIKDEDLKESAVKICESMQ